MENEVTASSVSDWASLVAVERDAARLRAEVNQSSARTEVLARGIASPSAWERSTALNFLRLFPEDVPRLLEPVIGLCLSAAWVDSAREVIRAARSDLDESHLGEVLLSELSAGDPLDYRMFADLLVELACWSALGVVIQQASQSADEEVRAIGEEFRRSYERFLS